MWKFPSIYVFLMGIKEIQISFVVELTLLKKRLDSVGTIFWQWNNGCRSTAYVTGLWKASPLCVECHIPAVSISLHPNVWSLCQPKCDFLSPFPNFVILTREHEEDAGWQCPHWQSVWSLGFLKMAFSHSMTVKPYSWKPTFLPSIFFLLFFFLFFYLLIYVFLFFRQSWSL